MTTLYLYPSMYGLPDNNPFGLKVDTFMRLTHLQYTTKHILDTTNAPRNQLPYLDDSGNKIGDSNDIIKYLCNKHHITIDMDLSERQLQTQFLLCRMMDFHLYWVMSYSRWQDKRYFPLFRNQLMSSMDSATLDDMEVFRNINSAKYKAHGIGRYSDQQVYQQGIDDLKAIASFLGHKDYIFGENIHIIDACCYGFLANIYYFDIDTPLKQYILSEVLLVKYIERIRSQLDY
jgi:glutathione S-transferase